MLAAYTKDCTHKVLPAPNLRAWCDECGEQVHARICTDIRSHFAHFPGSTCPRAGESESEWHAGWKARFPVDWQEVRLPPHRADVRTPSGRVIEFQHSRLSPADVAAREKHYAPKMVWVFDGVEMGLTVNPLGSTATFSVASHRADLLACELRQVYVDLGGDRLFKIHRQQAAPFHCGWGTFVPVDAFLRSYLDETVSA